MDNMSKNKTFSLDEKTIEMLEHQANDLHLSRSALIRLLLVRNNARTIEQGGIA